MTSSSDGWVPPVGCIPFRYAGLGCEWAGLIGFGLVSFFLYFFLVLFSFLFSVFNFWVSNFGLQICFAGFESRNYFKIDLMYYWSHILYVKILYVHPHIIICIWWGFEF
jgi:hypothetical protein